MHERSRKRNIKFENVGNWMKKKKEKRNIRNVRYCEYCDRNREIERVRKEKKETVGERSEDKKKQMEIERYRIRGHSNNT
jgi:hypothetical protein